MTVSTHQFPARDARHARNLFKHLVFATEVSEASGEFVLPVGSTALAR
ncbi:hypothetical protein [Halovenus sp. HT40]